MGMRTGCMLMQITLAMVCAALPGGAGGGKSTSPNVTTIVYDDDTNGAPLLMRSDDHNGSGQATYSPAEVPSYIFSNGAWFLRLYGQSIRTLYIIPNDAINNLQAIAPPPNYYWQQVEVAVGCYDQNRNVVPFQNILSSSGNCEMIVDFGYNGTEYKIVMGPTGNLPAPGPATGLVSVTCISVSNGQCVNWTITPNSTASGSNPPTLANLYQYKSVHGKTQLVIVGQYYHTFRINVSNP
jgi:hypothetical protein